MNGKIQKLCKRLNRFTLEEIALIAELDESETKNILQDLLKENFLIVHDNNYIYNNIEKESRLKKRLPKIFEYHSQETINMIISCFCAEISPTKTSLILKPQENCICNFNMFFRKELYAKQMNELQLLFEKNPKPPWVRDFFDKTFYFYCYNNKLFISDTLLQSKETINFTKEESKLFKILYCKLYRRLAHNTYRYYTQLHIAEQIWRYKKDFLFLESSLKSLLFN